MTIDELYRFVKFMANKEQRGFITITEFNLLANRAQLDVIQDRHGKYTSMANPGTIGFDSTHSALEDIRRLVDTFTSEYRADGHWWYPISSTAFTEDEYDITTTGTATVRGTRKMLYFLTLQLDGKNVEILTQDQLSGRLNSHLLGPSIDSPVACMFDRGFKIWISSDQNNDVSAGDVKITYIKIPNKPEWAYTSIASGNPVYNSTNSNQLTVPEHTHNEVAQRILSYIGISLREPEVQQYGEMKTKDKEQ